MCANANKEGQILFQILISKIVSAEQKGSKIDCAKKKKWCEKNFFALHQGCRYSVRACSTTGTTATTEPTHNDLSPLSLFPF